MNPPPPFPPGPSMVLTHEQANKNKTLERSKMYCTCVFITVFLHDFKKRV